MNLNHDDITLLIQKGLSFVNDGLYLKSEEIFNIILDQFAGQTVTVNELVVLNNLAVVYQKIGNHYKALLLLSRAQTFKPVTEEETSYYIATLMNLSAVNSALCSYNVALQQAFKSIELCENEKLVELKVTAYYNLSCILMTLNRFDKAGFYFRETQSLAKVSLGARHKISVLSHRASNFCLNPDSFHSRVKSSGYTLTAASSSANNSKIARYTAKILENSEDDGKIKINFSTKIASINKTGRTIVRKLSNIAAPYLREFRKNEEVLFKTPKKEKKIKKLRNKIFLKEQKNLARLLKIKDFFKDFERTLSEFQSGCKEVAKWVGFKESGQDVISAVSRIQKWFRNYWKRRKW